MTRERFVIRTWIACVVGLLLMAAPARADLLTIEFEGEIDLTSVGGAVYGYSGFFTWDTESPPNAEPEGAGYTVYDYQLTFGGIDVTQPTGPDTGLNGFTVVNDFDALGTGLLDAFVFSAHVGRPYDPTGDLFLNAALAGPTTMFGSSALPGNFDFLSDVTDQFVFMFFEPDDDEFRSSLRSSPVILDARGTFEITGTRIVPVPEPATLTLAAFGLASALARFRRRT